MSKDSIQPRLPSMIWENDDTCRSEHDQKSYNLDQNRLSFVHQQDDNSDQYDYSSQQFTRTNVTDIGIEKTFITCDIIEIGFRSILFLRLLIERLQQ